MARVGLAVTFRRGDLKLARVGFHALRVHSNGPPLYTQVLLSKSSRVQKEWDTVARMLVFPSLDPSIGQARLELGVPVIQWELCHNLPGEPKTVWDYFEITTFDL